MERETAAELLARYESWRAQRDALNVREEEGFAVSSGTWESSDEAGAALASDLAAMLREVVA